MIRVVKRYILTGAPGAGKTSVLRALGREHGYRVVEEAATDVIAASQASGVQEPWRSTGFTEAIAPLGFIAATQARPISYEESLIFEHLHEKAYGELGFELVEVPPGEVAARASGIDRMIRAWS